MKIHWTADYSMTGNGYGYTMHQRNMRNALEGMGVEMAEDADIAVHIVTPPSFNPVPGKFNVLFTMYEMAALPKDWPGQLAGADMLLVPCSHNRQLFARYTKLPIEVVWEGVKPDKFELRQRTYPRDRRFRFLWLGASNPRKGYEQVCVAWERFLKKYPEVRGKVELYLKTTQPGSEERNMNVMGAFTIFDNRDMPIDELIKLYHDSHCFLFPSMGEGWGLTLHEAMATGLPAIYTPWSAMRDWVPEKYAWPLKFTMRPIDTMRVTDTGEQQKYHTAPAAYPDIDHLVHRMYQVWSRYGEASPMAVKAAEEVRAITWERAAQELVDKVTPHYERWGEHGTRVVA